MRLSIELVDHILSFLQSDPVSLKACYESHPLLSQVAERYQFAHVILDDVLTSKFTFRPSEFTKVIHRHPHIATYVCSIEITGYFLELSSILPMMTLLKEVKLCGPRGRPGWEEIPEPSLLDLVHVSSKELEDVYISKIADFFPLSELHSVRRLTLCGWHEGEYPDTPKLDDSGAHKLQLMSLSFTESGRGSLQKVIAWVPPCTLRSLAILDSDLAFTAKCLAPFLDNCSNTLTNLELDLGSQFRSCTTVILGDASLDVRFGTNFPFTLSTLLHLEGLTVRANMDISTRPGLFDSRDDGRLRFYHPIPVIKHAVKTISSQTLKFLKLDCHFIIDSHQPLPPADVIWSSLVHLVAESPFPCIELHVRVGFDGSLAPDIILNSLAESVALMTYVNRGVLVVTSELPATNKQDAPAVETASIGPI